MTEENNTSESEVVTMNEIKVAIDGEVVSDQITAAMNRRQYEYVEAHVGGWLYDTDEISPGQRILEIGAGLGFVGSSLNKSGKVEKIFSYEANPKLLPLIREAHQLNDVESEVRHFLLGEEDAGFGSIFVPEHFWAANTRTAGKSIEYKVPNASFKKALVEIQPSFLLIDIEDGEAMLLNGVSELLSVHSVLIELHKRVIGRDGMVRLFEKMHSLGFGYDQRYSNGKVGLFQKINHPMAN